MPKDRFGEEIETVERQDVGPITYVIPAPNQNTKDLTMTVKCCLCNMPLEKRGHGWCYNCNTWPISATPVRFDKRGHSVSTGGWCMKCQDYTMSELDAQPGEWVDTGRYSRLITKAEIHRLAQDVQSKLSGPGWPDVQVPLRGDMIPRRWKHVPLKKVGETPLGYAIVLPASGIVEEQDTEVPF